jgi:hypothetical protein
LPQCLIQSDLLSDYISMNDEKSDWIFYLKLSKSLPPHYISLDKEFKRQGLTLIPISISELMSVTKGEGSFNVLVSIRHFADAKYFAKRIQKTFEFLLRARRINLFMSSSFEFTNQTNKYGKTKKYHFYPLPQRLDEMCDSIALNIQKDKSTDKKWPGSSRGLGLTVV